VDVKEGSSMQAQTVTLELTPKQAELLTTARAMGKLSMVLRSLHTPGEEKEDLSTTMDWEVSPFFSHLNTLTKPAGGSKPAKKVSSAPKKEKAAIKIYLGKSGGGGTTANEGK